jgi:hypothetical protein
MHKHRPDRRADEEGDEERCSKIGGVHRIAPGIRKARSAFGSLLLRLALSRNSAQALRRASSRLRRLRSIFAITYLLCKCVQSDDASVERLARRCSDQRSAPAQVVVYEPCHCDFAA